MNLDKKLKNNLVLREENHLYRSRKILQSAQSVEPVIDGKKVLSFSSNDYLGLANHPDVRESFKQAADKFGVGSGAAHLVSGHSLEHHALEEELADFFGRERPPKMPTVEMDKISRKVRVCIILLKLLERLVSFC